LDVYLIPITCPTFKCTSQVTRHVENSVTLGASILVGGPADVDMNSTGATFYKPTVLVNMTQEMVPFHEESFGPIAPLMKFQTEEEAIAIANNTKYVRWIHLFH
jgi:succinate-semialdehyde dehydrogenase / glutarate-semialdehyde dehydrogenase